MKKIFVVAASVLALFACSKPDDVKVAPPVQEKISVTPHTATIPNTGGSFDVIVSSSGEWTLTGKADYSSWVVPSVVKGVDGDIVKFTVQPNLGQEALVSDWTFTCGKAEDTFKLTSSPTEIIPDHLKLVTAPSVILSHEKGSLIVIAESSINYRDLKYSLSEGAESWLVYQATFEGDKEGEAKFVFEYTALEGLDDRQAELTLSAEGVEPVKVTVLQEAKHVLMTAKDLYPAKIDGETIGVGITANVAYSINISEEGKSWITHKEKKDGKEYFEIAAFSEQKRSAKVTFTQTDAKEGETPLSAEITITQQNAIIRWAVRMNGNRLFPKWENGGLGTCYNFTLECLIKPESFKKTGAVMTVMGIEGQFLLRFGDVGNSPNKIQIATTAGNWNIPEELPANRWTHVAITFGNKVATAYFNGVKIGEYTFQKQMYYGPSTLEWVNLSPSWSYEPSGNRCFWIGYSYQHDRDFLGLMTEFRIWKKTLTAEEINAPNHFYTVDPASEGLKCYWRVASGEGETIPNISDGGKNPLYGELNVRKQGSDNKGDAGIQFEPVSLPEN